jgi:hypothetical protein
MATDPQRDTPPVRRRTVYYLSGFDPRGARFYHQLYRDEAALQAPVNGCAYTVGGRRSAGEHATEWAVQSVCGDQRVDTRYVFLRWDDLVRDHWLASARDVITALPGFYWHHTTSGALGDTLRRAPRAFWSMVTPLVYGLLTVALAALLAWGAGWLAQRAFGSQTIGVGLGLVVAAGILKAGMVTAERLRLFWLSRILVFVVRWGRTRPAPLDTRWAAFAERIHADLANDPHGVPDEVLIVGHSVGAMAAVAVADRWLALQGGPPAPAVKLLTLGGVNPMLGSVPESGWFRDQLRRVGQSGMPWLDSTAPVDPLCFALVDPFDACGLTASARPGYRLKSARFDKMFASADYAQLQRDAFRIHFQYLMSTQLPVENDYFSLTAGPRPLPLADRAAQAPR